jgi:RNA polymerase sigma factor (sigma-70 family)
MGARSYDRLDEIEAVYRKRLPVFIRVVTAIVGDEQLGRDVVHDGFVRAVRYRSKLRADRFVEPWIWRIVLNEARKAGAREARTLAAGPVAPVESSQNGDPGLRGLIAALPERQRLVLFLRYFADLDYTAIAEATGVSPGTVGATLHQAQASLRKHLEEVPS